MENKTALSGGYLWRAIFGILVGLAMVIWPSFIARYLVMIIGAALIVVGIIVTVAYYAGSAHRDTQRRRLGMGFPIGGLLYMVVGILLVAMPDTFSKVIVIVMGIVLILAAVDHLWMLVRFARKGVRIGAVRYIIPAIILVVGIIMAASPEEWLHAMFIVFGVAAIVYGISDIADQYLIRKTR